ncbi:phosducin [Staphylotrichum tortipilum]|uniref:Phosducin n=1 Tax=Staphylotrichum tortipilum TaxID=2831512 RepID=A0AAN6MEC0_9PEZI|nr:phosducin [Staphylotrichum longicolle]
MAAPTDQRIAVPIDDPNADTEWNDILRKHGIIPEKPPSPTPLIEEAILAARQLAHDNRLEGKDLSDLSDLEDDEDETFLEQYRQKRMAEIAALQSNAIHGSVYPITKPEYARAVTEASQAAPVLVNLTAAQGSNVESRVLSQLWRQAAAEYGEVKFCEMRADKAIEGYPERNCPTILVYDKGDIVKQVVTLATVGGVRMGMLDLEKILVEVGAVKADDMRVLKRRRAAEEEADEKVAAGGKGIKSSRDVRRGGGDDDDDDWD